MMNSLIELNRPQPPKPLQVDNTTAVGFVNNKSNETIQSNERAFLFVAR